MTVNLWSVDKDVSIKKLLFFIDQKINLNRFQVFHDTDLAIQSIRLACPDSPGVSAYIFSYGQTSGNFGIELEYPELSNEQAAFSERFENLGIEKIIDVLITHFNLVDCQ